MGTLTLTPTMLPPESLQLDHHQIHIWSVDLEQSAAVTQRYSQLLSPDEHHRSQRFYFERDRRRFTLARGSLRQILGRYLNQDPASVRFQYGSYGKPALLNSTHQAHPLSFNVSHSHELSLIGLTWNRQIGVDVEYLRPLSDPLQLAERFFSHQEYQFLKSQPIAQHQLIFLQLWTAKEACLKATGKGLSGLEYVELAVSTEGPLSPLAIQPEEDITQWSLKQWVPRDYYLAALAVKGLNLEISCYQMDIAIAQP